MSQYKYYLLFNPELKNINDVKENYAKDILTNNRITSINSFFIKYPEFNINMYRKFNKEIENYPMIDILVHMHLYGYKNNLVYSDKTFYKKYPDFDINEYKKLNPHLNNSENIDIFYAWYKKEILVDEPIIIDTLLIIDKPLIIDTPLIIEEIHDIKLAHIFVHFFKIGGGECYVSNFNKYNNTFIETLFLNNNYSNETLFKFNGEIIYYNSYQELNKKLVDYDIILDHQLYWFDLEITKEVFFEIPKNHIIRIIHGVPIHFKDISEYEFYYSIELYDEYLSHNSWNNHIKIYNNIGVKNNKNIQREFNSKNINVAIIGRINIEKVPTIFFKNLLSFINIYKEYIFNFYGVIEENYLKYFINIVNKNKNIIYHGVIEPDLIEDVYLTNDILLHPSKFEAGATVVLEAMSFGLPVICRNVGGLQNAVGNNNVNFLCKNENEMFEKLLSINENNYRAISNNNVLKILNENDQEYLTKKLIDEIKNIYECELIDYEIPNIIHYIFGLKEQKEEFSFVYYLSIYSNFLINKPYAIYFHYQYLPYGYWWDKIKKYIKLNFINADDLYWGDKKIIKYAHKADKLRLDILLKYGGVYMDIDTISYKPYKSLLNYDFVIGIQEENYVKCKDNPTEGCTLYCNAILFSKKNNIFIKNWINEYEKHFLPDGWCEASVHLPNIIYNDLSNSQKRNIKVLDKEYFFYPLYNEIEKIFEGNEPIHNDLITLHFWNTFSQKYYENIKDFDWANNNTSLYAKLMNNILELEKIYKN